MRGKRTQATQKQAKTHQTKTKTRNRKTTTARGRFPLIKARFLCTRVRHVKTTKADCELTKGLNSLESRSAWSAQERSAAEPIKGASPHPPSCDQEGHCIEWQKRCSGALQDLHCLLSASQAMEKVHLVAQPFQLIARQRREACRL